MTTRLGAGMPLSERQRMLCGASFSVQWISGVAVALLYVATGAPPESATAVTTAPADALMLTGLRWRSRGCLATRAEGFRRLRWLAWWWLLALRSVPARWRSCCLRQVRWRRALR